ncbi:caveolae-associated protein 2 [Rhinatrema bivittatum]|uniref:caveolae-associated protein 2 n=1 Tax=Rhinatrema bivittatum TaxID=194408 RepID=UPI00112DCD8A|nr:caveolae-associated protein 2 [Rhinatrema bivittatum]
MGENAAQAEKSSAPARRKSSEGPESQELLAPSPAESPSPSPPLGDGSQVNAITVLTLLDKLVHMLDAVQENQRKMERRQIELEQAVKGIQGDVTKLAKSHGATGSAVGKLLEKSRKVSAHMRDVRERMDKQCSQVKRLESNHSLLLRRNHFKVLIFQEENEIPANVFVKDPASVPSITEGQEEPVDENKALEETLHTVSLSSDEEITHEDDALEDSTEEKLGESRAEKLKKSSLKKVDSLKKAFSRQNIEKKMNKIGTKIVSPERREKIKKSFTSTHHKASGKGSSFKVTPLTLSLKKAREGESTAKNDEISEETSTDAQAVTEPDKTSLGEVPSEMPSSTPEAKAESDFTEKEVKAAEKVMMNSNIELTIVEDNEEFKAGLDMSNEKHFEEEDEVNNTDNAEEFFEEPAHPAILQINQNA